MLTNNILSIKKLRKDYFDKNGIINAIDDITLDIKEGEFVSIVGPSGCGKTTLLSILAGLENLNSGYITYNKNIKIGYMLQQDSLFPWLTVLENCLLGLKVNHCLTDKSKERVISLLKTYGLEKFINKYPDSLSGGMKQRCALIRTLALNPDILLLDEPFSALDYVTRLMLSDDLYKIIKNEKKTAILVTHDIAEAVSLSDRVVVLSKRPTSIKNIYDIVYTEKSNPISNRNKSEFNKYYDLIWRDLDVHL